MKNLYFVQLQIKTSQIMDNLENKDARNTAPLSFVSPNCPKNYQRRVVSQLITAESNPNFISS